MASFQERMIRAAKLDADLYEEVEADESALNQAMGVVMLSALAGGFASLGEGGVMGMFVRVLGGLFGWYVWAFMTYIIGTKLLPESQTESNYGELLRTLGFAAAPGLIQVVGIVPGLQSIVYLVAHVWMLIAMVIAVRQALDYTSTMRAVGVCIIGWVVLILVNGILLSLIAPPPA